MASNDCNLPLPTKVEHYTGHLDPDESMPVSVSTGRNFEPRGRSIRVSDNSTADWTSTTIVPSPGDLDILEGKIEKAENGFILYAGCQGKFVYKTEEQLLKGISKLIKKLL